MKPIYVEADNAALSSYHRAHSRGAPHEVAFNIAVSVWFCRCPHIDGGVARVRVSRLLNVQSARHLS